MARLRPEPAGWSEENWASFELEAVLHAVDGQADTFMSQNRFRGKRRAVANVLELCSMYTDLDHYKVPELSDLSPEAVLEKVLERLREEGIPGPSLALSSGRGLQAVWAHKPVGRKELRAWNAAQDRILRVLGPMGADHEGSLLRYMRGWVAKGELLKTAERTRRGLARKIREGKVIRGRRPPMGFAYADGGDRLIPSEPEMDAVRLIFSMIGARGATMGEAARALRDRGIKPPGGGNWHRPTIRRVVLSPLYRPLTACEAAGSGLLSPEAASGLDPDKTYGLWTFNTKRRKKWKERGPDGEIRSRYSVQPRPREEWQAVAVDLSGSGLSRAHVDAARESIRGNTRRPASTASERFWQLSGGVARCGVCGSALSPHTTSRAGGRKAPYYRCFQRYNSGPRDCTNTKTLPAAPLEEAVWRKVRLLLEEPERVMAAYDAYVEIRGRRLRGDPDREARGLSARLEKLERRRSKLIDMGADGIIGREDLRAKMAEADEERDSLRRALQEAAGRGEELERLRKEREVLAERFSAMRGMGLRHLPPQDRRSVYDALRMTAHADKNGDVSITGIFGADITELLPMSWAQAKASAHEYDVGLNIQLPKSYKGVVSVEHPRPGT